MSNPMHMPNLAWPFLKRIKSRRRRMWVAGLLAVCGIVVVIAIVLAVYAAANVGKLRAVYSESMSAKQSLEFAQVAISNQDFDRAVRDLIEGNEHFIDAKEALKRFEVYQFVPGLAAQVRAIDSVLTAGVNLSSGLESLAVIGGKIVAVMEKENDSASFADLSIEDKRAMLQVLAESTVDLHGVRAEIELAVLALENIPDEGLLGAVRDAVEPVKQQIPVLDALINRVLPTAQLLPSILGYPDAKTYLFLLQNNRELRPTGGFIGTYGILKMDAGEVSIKTDNIYNIDNPASGYVTEPSPEPIARHTTTQNWLLRNINWSPDFPTTARKAEAKYHEEGGEEKELDGVLAVTPTFIESLLGLVGSITVDGVTFTKENFFEKLQYEVEFAYYDKGISDSDRKRVIGDLSKELMNRLLHLPRNRFQDIYSIFTENVDQKQILVYVDEPLVQELVRLNNWSGELQQKSSDYFMIVDANLAALKTDEKMERSVKYTVSNDGDVYKGVLDVTYHNTTQQISEFYTRYRTHTRIYLPHGAQLLSADGYLTNDRAVHRGVPTQPDTYEETFQQEGGEPYTFTVVGGFTSIEPLETRTLHLEYILPQYVAEQIKNGTYDLYVQKQPGTLAHALNVIVDIGRKPREFTGLDMQIENRDNAVLVESDLSIDRHINILY